MNDADRELVDKALAEKDSGNEAFKANDLQRAMKHYYKAILSLRGFAMKRDGTATMVGALRARKEQHAPKISELTEDSEGLQVDGDANEDGPESAAGSAEASPAPPADEDKYTTASAKKTLAQCYVNVATCLAKKEEWAKCRRNAESALKEDPDNFKAAFRQAQASVRLGEITKGKKLLLDLQKRRDDAAIRNELKILAAAEAGREKKHEQSFRGFLGKASPAKVTETA